MTEEYRIRVDYTCWHTVEAEDLGDALEQVKDVVAQFNGWKMCEYATYNLDPEEKQA